MSNLYAPTQLEKQLKLELLKAIQDLPPNYVDRIATRVSSASNNEKYAWLGESPQVEELVDEVKFFGLTDTGYTLTNKTYSAGLAVKRADLEDDLTGGIKMRIKQLAEQAKRYPNKLLIDALINGTSTTLGLDYTGAAFFVSNHAARGQQTATQDNMITGTGTTTAQVAADLNSALSKMLNLKDEANEPFDESPSKFAVVYGPDLNKPMREALHASIVSNTSNAQFEGLAFDLLPTSRLSDANDWYLLNVGRSLRPLIFQERTPLEFEALEDGESNLRREQWLYKVRMRCAVGYGQFQTAIKVNNS